MVALGHLKERVDAQGLNRINNKISNLKPNRTLSAIASGGAWAKIEERPTSIITTHDGLCSSDREDKKSYIGLKSD